MEKKSRNKSGGTNPFFRRETTQWPQTAEPAGQAASKATATATAAAPAKPASPPTHAEIAERAKAVWKAHGCQAGRDRENWLEAEAQLRAERGIR